MRKTRGVPVGFISPEKYKNIYRDIDNTMGVLLNQASWIQPVAETALSYGIISSDRGIFEPDRNMTRAEAFAVITGSICATTDTRESELWQQRIHRLARANDLTSRDWNNFEPEKPITRQELFILASRASDLAERTGGCDPKPEVCFLAR